MNEKTKNDVLKIIDGLRSIKDTRKREAMIYYYLGVMDGMNRNFDGFPLIRDGKPAEIREFYNYLSRNAEALEAVATPKKKGRNKDGFHIEGFHVWLVRHKQLWRVLH